MKWEEFSRAQENSTKIPFQELIIQLARKHFADKMQKTADKRIKIQNVHPSSWCH
jgi:hypothetical protein